MNLKGCFTGDEDYPQLNNHIFVLYRKDANPEYTTYIEFCKTAHNFLKSYEPDKFHEMLVYEVPSDYLGDYTKFRNSKYSELRPKYKQHIIRFFNLTKIDSDGSLNRIVAILYKDPDFKKWREETLDVVIPDGAELGSVWDPETEVYNDSMKVKTTTPNTDLLPT
jgi:hypothetical protein